MAGSRSAHCRSPNVVVELANTETFWPAGSRFFEAFGLLFLMKLLFLKTEVKMTYDDA